MGNTIEIELLSKRYRLGDTVTADTVRAATAAVRGWLARSPRAEDEPWTSGRCAT